MFPGLLRLREALLAAVAGIVASILLRIPLLNQFKPDVRLSGSQTLTNGTHAWTPTVLLISLDGFKPAYIDSGLVPTLANLTHGRLDDPSHRSALSAEYMYSVNPSLTFPNHWSLQTGLQPSSHGILANDFHTSPLSDGRLRKNSSFYYTDPAQSWDAKWWKGSAIWQHLERNGIKTANLMWPGPPITADNISSSHFQPFVKGWTVEQRHDKVMQWLDLAAEERPSFICAYAPDVDTASHKYGPDPNLASVAEALRNVDKFIGSVLNGIHARNVTSIINVVIVSDHGMTFTSNDRLVYLDEALGDELMSQALTIDGWPNVGLRFRTSEQYAEAEKRLLAERQRWIERGRHAFDVLKRDQVVQRWGWTMNELVKDRMAELWVLPEVGWSITTRIEMLSFNNDYSPKGNHGYDANHPDMHAFFAALGPAIRRRKDSKAIAPFKNLEIHNLVMAMLGVEGAPNNGTVDFWSKYVQSPQK